MKKRMTRLFALLIVALFCLAACGPKEKAPENTASTIDSSNAEKSSDGKSNDAAHADFSEFKLGIVTWSTTDTLGKKQHDLVTYAMNAIGAEVVFNTDATSHESQITCVENLIAAGCNGIVIVNYTESILVKIAEICESNGVYFAQFGRTIRDEDIKKKVEQSPYFAGRSYSDDFSRGYEMGKLLAEQGHKKIAVTTNVVGDTTIDLRDEGFNKACEEFGIERIAEVRAPNDATIIGKGVENFITSFPEMDAIFMPATVNNYLETTLNILEKYDKIGEIKIAAINFTESAKPYLEKDVFTAVIEGDFLDPFFSAILVANAFTGTPLSEEGHSELVLNLPPMKNSQEVIDYYTYIEGENFPFTEDEIRNMCRIFNSEFNIDAMNEIISDFNVESIKKKTQQ